MSHEVEKMRRWLHAQLALSEGAKVLDLGCGAGDDLRLLAESAPKTAEFVGIDRSAEWIEKANAANADPRIRFVHGDAGHSLPVESRSFDAVYSVNLLECLPDKRRFFEECARVLRPGGTLLVAHFDWDTQTFDGSDRALVRRIVHAFNDWQQAWMETIDPWAGRRLYRYVHEAGAFEGEVRAYTLTDTAFQPGSYARRQAESLEALVRRNLVSREEYETFMEFLHDSAVKGTFFYSVTLFAYVGFKR